MYFSFYIRINVSLLICSYLNIIVKLFSKPFFGFHNAKRLTARSFRHYLKSTFNEYVFVDFILTNMSIHSLLLCLVTIALWSSNVSTKRMLYDL